MIGGAGKLETTGTSVNERGRRRRAVILGLFIVAIAACSGGAAAIRAGTHEVRTYLGDAKRAPSGDATIDTAPALVWRTKNVKGSTALPAVGPQITLVTTIDKYVYALETRTGRTLWRHRAQTTFGVGPVTGGGRVFAGSEGPEGTVRGLALSNGRLRWRVRVGDVSAPLVYHDSLVFVSTHAGSLIALRADNGRRRWEIPQVPSLSGPLVHQGQILLLTLTDTLLVADAASGRVARRFALGFSSAAPMALIDDSTLAIANGSGEIVAVSIPTGRVNWRVALRDIPAGAPVVRGDTVFAITNTCRLNVIPNGNPSAVRSDSIGCLTKATPLLVRDGVVVATVDGRLLYYRPGERRVVWTRRLGYELRHPPVLQDGLLIAAPARGQVVGLR